MWAGAIGKTVPNLAEIVMCSAQRRSMGVGVSDARRYIIGKLVPNLTAIVMCSARRRAMGVVYYGEEIGADELNVSQYDERSTRTS